MDKLATSTFHPVGQGLFYSFSIDDFNFVYDCGSENRIPRLNSIRRYKSKPSKHIDLLVLSHLHQDHVNGLDDLLKGITVNTLVMPYLSPFERAYLAMLQPGVKSWYYQFLVNPISTLLNITDINRVVLIGRQRGEGDERINEDDEIPPDLDKMDDKDGLRLISENDEQLEIAVKKYDSALLQKISDIVFKMYYGKIVANKFWIFSYYNLPWMKKQDEMKFKKFLKINHIDPNNQSQLLNIISVKKTRLNMKKSYPLNQDRINNTSVVIYHGPINQKDVLLQPWYFPVAPFYFRYSKNVFSKYWGHILTGDIKMETTFGAQKAVAKILNHFNPWLDDIHIALIPHHGAFGYWSTRFLTNLSRCDNWVVSAKTNHKYHPGRKVLLDILQRGKQVLFSNENKSVKFKALVKF